MIEFVISGDFKKLSVFRSCPDCDTYLAWKYGENCGLRRDRFLKQKQKKDGSWFHTTQAGRSLHKISIG